MIRNSSFFKKWFMKYVYFPLDDYKFKNFDGESDINKVVVYAWARSRYMNPKSLVYDYSTMLRFAFFIILEKIKYYISHKVPETKWVVPPK